MHTNIKQHGPGKFTLDIEVNQEALPRVVHILKSFLDQRSGQSTNSQHLIHTTPLHPTSIPFISPKAEETSPTFLTGLQTLQSESPHLISNTFSVLHQANLHSPPPDHTIPNDQANPPKPEPQIEAPISQLPTPKPQDQTLMVSKVFFHTDPLDHSNEALKHLIFQESVPGWHSMGDGAGWLITASSTALNIYSTMGNSLLLCHSLSILQHLRVQQLDCMALSKNANLLITSSQRASAGPPNTVLSSNPPLASSARRRKRKKKSTLGNLSASTGTTSSSISYEIGIYSLGGDEVFTLVHSIPSSTGASMITELSDDKNPSFAVGFGKSVSVYSLRQPYQPVKSWKVHNSKILSMESCRDISLGLLTGSSEEIILWDLRTYSPAKTFVKKNQHFSVLKCASDFQFLSGSTDGVVHLWDQRNESEPVSSIILKGAITALDFDPVSKYVSATTTGGIFMMNEDLSELQKVHFIVEENCENLSSKQRKRAQQRQKQLNEMGNRPIFPIARNTVTQQLYGGFTNGIIGAWV